MQVYADTVHRPKSCFPSASNPQDLRGKPLPSREYRQVGQKLGSLKVRPLGLISEHPPASRDNTGGIIEAVNEDGFDPRRLGKFASLA